MLGTSKSDAEVSISGFGIKHFIINSVLLFGTSFMHLWCKEVSEEFREYKILTLLKFFITEELTRWFNTSC